MNKKEPTPFVQVPRSARTYKLFEPPIFENQKKPEAIFLILKE